MEAVLIFALLIALAALSLRYGSDSSHTEARFLSKEQELASYGVTWNHPAQAVLRANSRVARAAAPAIPSGRAMGEVALGVR